MWTLIIAPMVVALATAILAWHHAGRLDRQQNEGGPGEAEPGRNTWTFALAALVVAVVATTILQIAMLSALAPR